VYRGLTIACVIPAFNESGAIARTIGRVPRFVDRIICVDDASIDDTFALARRTGRRGLEVLRHDENRGVGAAIVTGYRHVQALGLDVAVVMAGDGQMDPSDLPGLLDPIAEGRAGYVKGNRFRAAGVWRAMPPARIAGNLALSLATKLVSGYWHVFDSQCGYTAIDRATLERIDLGRLFPRYGYPNDLLARLHSAAVRVVDVPVRAIYGPGWRSGIRLRTVVHPILSVLAAAWARRVGIERLGLRAPPALEAPDEQTAWSAR
jgi:glycosyltransferase involved in cell wall biosynthesis